MCVTEGGAVALANAVKAEGPTPAAILYPTSDAGMRQPEQAQALEVLSSVGPRFTATLSIRCAPPNGLVQAASLRLEARPVASSSSARAPIEHVAATPVYSRRRALHRSFYFARMRSTTGLARGP